MEKISGDKLHAPLITHIGTAQAHRAQRIQDWHSHHGFEILFVAGGATAWEFRDGPTREVTGGHFIVIPPGVVHRGSHGIRKPSRICGIVFDPGAPHATRNSAFSRADLQRVAANLAGSRVAIGAGSAELIRNVNRLIEAKDRLELTPADPLLLTRIRVLACDLILESSCTVSVAPPTEQAKLVEAAKIYLQRKPDDAISIADLVKHMGFSRSYLFSIFKEFTGMTPNDYHVRSRIDRAKELLLQSHDTITAIAFETGFSTSQYFSTVFRKHTGQTPAEFRHTIPSPAAPA